MQRAVPEKKKVKEIVSTDVKGIVSTEVKKWIVSMDLKGMNSDIAQLENYFGHECEVGVKVLL